MERDTLAVIISCCSLVVSFAALGWSVYRELALKARVKTTMAIGEWYVHGESSKKLLITVTNHGPGPVQVGSFTVKPPRWRKFDVRYNVLPFDFDDPLATRLPVMLSVGQTANVVLRYGPDLFLAGGASRVGIIDSFGRVHWTSRRDGRRALKQFKSEFGLRRAV
ncbi:MAG: hypothetical protein WA208_21550 [Thermoanaerobaculia bacterium]